MSACAFCNGPLPRAPIVRGGSAFCSAPCASRRPSPTLALAFDNPKVGSFERAPGVRPMTERIAEIYTPPSNVTIAEAPALPRVPPTRSTLAAIAEADRAQASILRAVVAELVAAKDAGDWSRVTTATIELAKIAHGLERVAAAGEAASS